MLEVYLRGNDPRNELSDFQERDLESLKKSLIDYFYYNGSKDIIRIEEIDLDTGDVLREFNSMEMLDIGFEIDALVQERKQADQEFLGAILAAKESLKINPIY